jgi:hypothetical protein
MWWIGRRVWIAEWITATVVSVECDLAVLSNSRVFPLSKLKEVLV